MRFPSLNSSEGFLGFLSPSKTYRILNTWKSAQPLYRFSDRASTVALELKLLQSISLILLGYYYLEGCRTVRRFFPPEGPGTFATNLRRQVHKSLIRD